ncbi:unnamed protein product [Camellia sinensis]
MYLHHLWWLGGFEFGTSVLSLSLFIFFLFKLYTKSGVPFLSPLHKPPLLPCLCNLSLYSSLYFYIYIHTYILSLSFKKPFFFNLLLFRHPLDVLLASSYNMKSFHPVSLLSDPKRILPTWKMNNARQNRQSFECNKLAQISLGEEMNHTRQDTQSNKCKNQCRPVGSEALPEGIIARNSNLEMRPLWGPVAENITSKPSVNLLAIAVGIKLKQIVKQIVEKFLASDFVVMLFHYDDVVDEWRDFGWSSRVIHVSVMNQTKWWFAKRFLHPDIVAEYDYIFLWDEDLGVQDFDPARYLSIVKDEGLEISQPALDPAKSEVHHQITARRRNSKVHRRFYKLKGSGRCDDRSTAPPCIGWVEMMAPVFSRAAWRCAWYMLQGDRTKNVGVVDSEYIVHLGLPTLGVSDGTKEPSGLHRVNNRTESEETVLYGNADFQEKMEQCSEGRQMLGRSMSTTC